MSTTAVCKAEALQRARRACALVEQAQRNLEAACRELSSLRGASAKWKQTYRQAEQVHQLWYRVERVLRVKSLTLDDLNAREFLAALATRGTQHAE
jgi:hypothetical protein